MTTTQNETDTQGAELNATLAELEDAAQRRCSGDAATHSHGCPCQVLKHLRKLADLNKTVEAQNALILSLTAECDDLTSRIPGFLRERREALERETELAAQLAVSRVRASEAERNRDAAQNALNATKNDLAQARSESDELAERRDYWQETSANWHKSYMVLMRENDVLQVDYAKLEATIEQQAAMLEKATEFQWDGWTLHHSSPGLDGWSVQKWGGSHWLTECSEQDLTLEAAFAYALAKTAETPQHSQNGAEALTKQS